MVDKWHVDLLRDLLFDVFSGGQVCADTEPLQLLVPARPTGVFFFSLVA